MRVLTVYAHPTPRSFCRATCTRTFLRGPCGHDVTAKVGVAEIEGCVVCMPIARGCRGRALAVRRMTKTRIHFEQSF